MSLQSLLRISLHWSPEDVAHGHSASSIAFTSICHEVNKGCEGRALESPIPHAPSVQVGRIGSGDPRTSPAHDVLPSAGGGEILHLPGRPPSRKLAMLGTCIINKNVSGHQFPLLWM